MANYQTSLRTNLFHVVDEELFEAFMDNLIVDGDAIDILRSVDINGLPLYGFATHGTIIGSPFDFSGTIDVIDGDETDDGAMYDAFILGLQELVDEDDAVIMLEIGNEKLNDVYAGVTIVTAQDTDYIDMREMATNNAIDMLKLQGGVSKRES